MASVRATRVDSITDSRDVPGAFKLVTDGKDTIGMTYVCPCGCKRIGFLNFEEPERPRWSWDGNVESPTLTPSVHHVMHGLDGTTTHWHGWLTNGEWVSCLSDLLRSRQS